MEMVACQCSGLPAHDHFMGQDSDERGVWGPVWDMDDIGRIWVDWKAVAHDLELENHRLKDEIVVDDQLLEERQRLLDAIPECPAHGHGCIPHAVRWVEEKIGELDHIRALVNEWDDRGATWVVKRVRDVLDGAGDD